MMSTTTHTMKYTFTAWGHPNITGTHKNTIEFTKDSEIGIEADCIIGVKADFNRERLMHFIREQELGEHTPIRLCIEAGEEHESLYFTCNILFDDNKELVIRTTNFCSKRTLGVQATKSAKYLSRAFVSRLCHPEQQIVVTLSKV